MPEMSVLKRWKYGKKKSSSKCSLDNNNNVNAFLTCTTQEAAPFSSYNSTVNLFSPFSSLVLSRTPPFRFGLSLPFLYIHTNAACAEKKREVFRHAEDTRTRARIQTRRTWRGRGGPNATSKWNGHGRGGRLRVSREEDALSLLCLAQSFASIEV